MEYEEIKKKFDAVSTFITDTKITFNKLEKRIKKQEELVASLSNKLNSVAVIYTNIQMKQKDNLKTFENRMAIIEARKLQAENMRKSILPKVVKSVIDVVCKSNNNTFENLFLESNFINNQMTRHEVNYCLNYYFNPRFKGGKYILESNISLGLSSIGLITSRDHASVLHSCNVIINETETIKKYKIYIDAMLAQCLIAIKESLKVEEK